MPISLIMGATMQLAPDLDPVKTARSLALSIADSLVHERGLQNLNELKAALIGALGRMSPAQRKCATLHIAPEEVDAADDADVYTRIAQNIRLYEREIEAQALIEQAGVLIRNDPQKEDSKDLPFHRPR